MTYLRREDGGAKKSHNVTEDETIQRCERKGNTPE